MPDEPGVLWIPNSNAFLYRHGYQPKYIIAHATAGGTSAQAIAEYFKSTEGGNNPVSSHYIIGQDGTIVQCVLEKDGAWANGVITNGHDPWWDDSVNPNDITISIEHCKPSADNSDALTPAQQAASFKLINALCARWHIPMQAADANGGITGHFSIDPANRSHCPGIYPFDDLYQYLQQGGDTPMTPCTPQGWHDTGTTLKAPNGVPVVKGFRDYILGDPTWDVDNWPLQPEEARNPLEVSNPSLGAGTQQIFRLCALEWTPARGVFTAWIGQEVIALRKLIHKD
jgi:hypothetical protein